jgi:hypothetical protein
MDAARDTSCAFVLRNLTQPEIARIGGEGEGRPRGRRRAAGLRPPGKVRRRDPLVGWAVLMAFPCPRQTACCRHPSPTASRRSSRSSDGRYQRIVRAVRPSPCRWSARPRSTPPSVSRWAAPSTRGVHQRQTAVLDDQWRTGILSTALALAGVPAARDAGLRKGFGAGLSHPRGGVVERWAVPRRRRRASRVRGCPRAIAHAGFPPPIARLPSVIATIIDG